MNQIPHPVLYSFRRCPYAMRARLALLACNVQVELREVLLRDKPEEMLAISPKGTVPVLLLPDGSVIEESFEIMHWATTQSQYPLDIDEVTADWVTRNDTEFKPWLDRYKYADRYPEHPEIYYRDQCERWFDTVEQQLERYIGGLLGDELGAVDYALLPFVRQCAHVDRDWFDTTPYPHVQSWLKAFLASDIFEQCMQKYPVWNAGNPAIYLNERSSID